MKIEKAFFFGEHDGGDIPGMLDNFHEQYDQILHYTADDYINLTRELKDCVGECVAVWGAKAPACINFAIAMLLFSGANVVLDLENIRIGIDELDNSDQALSLRAKYLAGGLNGWRVDWDRQPGRLFVAQKNIWSEYWNHEC